MKYIIGIISILVLISVGCYLFYMWDVGSFRNKLLTEYPKTQSTDTDTAMHSKGQSDVANASHRDGKTSKSSKNAVNDTNTQSVSPETEGDDMQADNGNLVTEDAHIHGHVGNDEIQESPFGFGVYPEIPAGFPLAASWQFPGDMFPIEIQRQGELVSRVLIKLYNEGDHDFVAGKWHKGKVYPIYPNTFYVQVNEGQIEVGENKLKTETIRILGPSGTRDIQKRLEKAISAGKSLPGVRVRDMQEYGIDPYNYLFSK